MASTKDFNNTSSSEIRCRWYNPPERLFYCVRIGVIRKWNDTSRVKGRKDWRLARSWRRWLRENKGMKERERGTREIVESVAHTVWFINQADVRWGIQSVGRISRWLLTTRLTDIHGSTAEYHFAEYVVVCVVFRFFVVVERSALSQHTLRFELNNVAYKFKYCRLIEWTMNWKLYGIGYDLS